MLQISKFQVPVGLRVGLYSILLYLVAIF